MGGSVVSPEEMRKMSSYSSSYYGSTSSSPSFEEKMKLEYEQARKKFIESITAKQTEADQDIINILNQKEDSVQRKALVTSGKIKSKSVFLSIDEKANLIYDVVDKNRCVTMFVEKNTEHLSSLIMYYELSLITKGNRKDFSSVNMYLNDWDENDLGYLPKHVVQEQRSYNLRSMSDLKSSEIEKLTKFVNTYLFAGTDVSATKTGIKKKEEEDRKLQEKLEKIRRKKEEQEKQKAQKAQERKIKEERKENKSFVAAFSSRNSFWEIVKDKFKGGLFK